MVASMTAFARQASNSWVWEIRSVNHRFLDISFSLPASLQELEPQLINRTRELLSRGRIEATLTPVDNESSISSHVNPQQVRRVITDLLTVQSVSNEPGFQIQTQDINLFDILNSTGVVSQKPILKEEAHVDIVNGFDQAMDKLMQVRQTEGEAIKSGFLKRIKEIKKVLATLASFANLQVEYMNGKLRDRLEELQVEFDEEQFEAEFAQQVQKADVAEELERMDVHVSEFEACLKKNDPHGRRLGFIVQEMSRESNTVGAKLIISESVRITTDLKVLIDQIREQVQNVE